VVSITGPMRELRPEGLPPPPRQSIPYTHWDHEAETHRIMQQNLRNGQNQIAALLFNRTGTDSGK